MSITRGKFGRYWVNTWLSLGRLTIKTIHVGIHGHVDEHVDDKPSIQLVIRFKKAKVGGTLIVSDKFKQGFLWWFRPHVYTHGVTYVREGEAIYLLITLGQVCE